MSMIEVATACGGTVTCWPVGDEEAVVFVGVDGEMWSLSFPEAARLSGILRPGNTYITFAARPRACDARGPVKGCRFRNGMIAMDVDGGVPWVIVPEQARRLASWLKSQVPPAVRGLP